MQQFDLLLTLTGSLSVALACGYAAHRLGLSPLVGYLLAGLVVGPFTPGFTANTHLAEELAEIGVILLMFGVGLQFHFRELLAVGRVAIPGATCASVIATGLGLLVGLAFGWGLTAGLVYGMALSVASTVVLMRVLSDSGDLHTPAGHTAVGWLVAEDLFTILVLVLMPAVATPGIGAAGIALAVLVAVGKVGLMVVLTFVLGDRVIPWLLDRAAASRSRELFTLTVLVVALGIAIGSVKLFGVSMELGAFLAGMVVGRTEFSLRAATEALPMRDAFAVLFFVSVGSLFHPRFLIESPGLVAATLAVVVLGKPLTSIAIVLALRGPARTALSVSLATAQIGEFSFIMASVAGRLGVLSDQARNALIAAAIVSIALNPPLYRLINPLERLLRKRLGTTAPSGVPTRIEGGGEAASEPDSSQELRYRAVIVGYGPVGRTLARLLRESRIEPVIVELNVATVRRLTGEGVKAIYGDATHSQTLESAGVEDAVALVLSSSSTDGVRETIRAARELNPRILIFARSTYLHEVAELRQAGADLVFSGEGEVAMAMMESMLRQLRATPEQIDRQREKTRSELFHDLADSSTTAVPTDRILPEAAGPPLPPA